MKWDTYFTLMADLVSHKSKDPSTKVGCVIVGPDNEILSTGYNGLPRGANDNLPERNERPEKYQWYEHAERNAIYNAARIGVSLKGCRAYLTHMPCMDCARGLVQSGVVEVVVKRNTDPELQARWGDSWKKTAKLFDETDVKLRTIAPEMVLTLLKSGRESCGCVFDKGELAFVCRAHLTALD